MTRDRNEIEIDFAAIGSRLLAERKLIGWITAAVTILAIVYALLSPSIYRAQILVMPLSQSPGPAGLLSGQFSELAALNGFSLTGSSDANVQRALATLKSRALTESFMKEAGVLQAMFPSMWDAEKKTWKATGWWRSDDKSAGPSLESAYRAFDSGIRNINFDRKTNLTTVTIDWTDPELAAKWANQLVKHVNAHLQAETIHDAERNIEYLKQQLRTNAAVEVQQAIYNLIESQLKNIMVANTREDYAFKVIDPATVPEKRLKPSRRLIVLVGLFLGLMLGAATALARPKLEPVARPLWKRVVDRWNRWKPGKS